MTTQPGADNDSQQKSRWPRREVWQSLITVVVLLSFAAAAIFMLSVAPSTDADVWQRRVYVFSGVQAITFTAVGWLFGREVSSGAVNLALDEADEAKAHARRAIAESNDARGRAMAVLTLTGALAETSKAAERTGSPAFGATDSPMTIQRVHEMIEEIYKQ